MCVLQVHVAHCSALGGIPEHNVQIPEIRIRVLSRVCDPMSMDIADRFPAHVHAQ